MTGVRILRRSDPVQVTTNREGAVDILVQGRWVRFRPSALAILDAFATPRAVSDVVGELGARAAGRQHWIDITRTIVRLRRHGVLVAPAAPVAPSALDAGFATAAAHISLLNDRARTRTMIEAIERVVQPGDTVLEIGTGCGVLAVAAARAGAAHVYAVEATNAVAAARALCDTNAVGERVTVIHGWSTQVTLPVKANVLVAEIAGNDPFTLHLLEIVLDARSRLLNAGATIIPSRVRLFAQPLAIEDADVERAVFTPRAAARWREWYGIEFRGLTKDQLLPAVINVPRDVVSGWQRAGDPHLLAELDFGMLDTPVMHRTLTVEASADAVITAVAAFTEVELAPGVTRSASPYVDDPGVCWTIPVWLCPEPLRIAAGERYTLSLDYPGTANRTMITVAKAP
jgi:protein arginine N-methyltransferase 1